MAKSYYEQEPQDPATVESEFDGIVSFVMGTSARRASLPDDRVDVTPIILGLDDSNSTPPEHTASDPDTVLHVMFDRAVGIASSTIESWKHPQDDGQSD